MTRATGVAVLFRMAFEQKPEAGNKSIHQQHVSEKGNKKVPRTGGWKATSQSE